MTRLKQATEELRKAIINDRRLLMDNLVADLASANPKEISRCMQPLKMGKRAHNIGRKQLPMVELQDGSLAPTREAATTRWREYFSDMEAGTHTTLKRMQDEFPEAGNCDMSYDDLPSILEVEEQFRRSKSRKASWIRSHSRRASPMCPSRARISVLPTDTENEFVAARATTI